MEKMQGLIALDIDGTLTTKDHLIPDEVVSYLRSLQAQGWQIALITGRMLSFARRAIANIDFPYYLGVQNGADILSMPDETLFQRAYLESDFLAELDSLYEGLDTDYLISSGYEKGDFCFYRPDRFPEGMHGYLKKLETLGAPWHACKTFDVESFPIIKCVGSKESLEPIAEKLRVRSDVATAFISDPISDGFYHLILITDAESTKGKAVRRIANALNITYPIIAAGDDDNDVPMLIEADIAIAMGGAPQHVLDHGDILAKPSHEMGIIEALQTATR